MPVLDGGHPTYRIFVRQQGRPQTSLTARRRHHLLRSQTLVSRTLAMREYGLFGPCNAHRLKSVNASVGKWASTVLPQARQAAENLPRIGSLFIFSVQRRSTICSRTLWLAWRSW